MWEVQATQAFVDLWHELSEKEQDDVTAIVELLAEMGPKLPSPYSSGIKGSRHSHMRELRIQSSGDPISRCALRRHLRSLKSQQG